MKKAVLLTSIVLLLATCACAPYGATTPSAEQTTTICETTLPSILTPVPKEYTEIPYVEITEYLIFYSHKEPYSTIADQSPVRVSIPVPEPASAYWVVHVSDQLEMIVSSDSGGEEKTVHVESYSLISGEKADILEFTVPAGRTYSVDLVNEKYIVWYTSRTLGLEQVEPVLFVYDRFSHVTKQVELPQWEGTNGLTSLVPTSRIIEMDGVLYFEMITGQRKTIGFLRDIAAYDIATESLSVYQANAANPYRVGDRIAWCEIDGTGDGIVRGIRDREGERSSLADVEVNQARLVVGQDIALVNDSVQSWQIESAGATAISNEAVDGRGLLMIRDGIKTPIVASRNAAYVLAPKTDGKVVVFSLNGCASQPLYYDIAKGAMIELDEAVAGTYQPWITKDHMVFIQSCGKATTAKTIDLCYIPIS